MSSQFDMNAYKPCPVCMATHPYNQKCSHDLLVKMVNTMRREADHLIKSNKEIAAVLRAYKEAVETAQQFQTIVRQMESELTRLMALEEQYLKVIAEYGAKELSPEISGIDAQDIQQP